MGYQIVKIIVAMFYGFVKKIAIYQVVAKGLVGAVINRPPKQIACNLFVFRRKNQLSPCGDVILSHKITRAINDRPYDV